MKKSAKKPGRKRASTNRRASPAAVSGGTGAAVSAESGAHGGPPAAASRRSLLRLARNGAIAMAVLGGGGWLAVRQVQSHYTLRDLSVIGNGTPSVVQIHDPTCPICTRLQKEMLAAAEAFDEGALQVRVATIDSTEGRALASRHGVSHATLLLFDGQGRVRRVLAGANDRDVLRNAFAAHLARRDRTAAGS